MGFLLLGGPGETRQSVEGSLAFADSLPLEMLKITTGIRIYPETPLAALAPYSLRNSALRAALASGEVCPHPAFLKSLPSSIFPLPSNLFPLTSYKTFLYTYTYTGTDGHSFPDSFPSVF